MLTINRFSQTPIYEQVIERFEFMIAQDQLPLDEPLPSVRSLSQELSVNPNTLQKAFTELERRGLCYSVPGNGRFVAPDAKQKLSEHMQGYWTELEDVVQKLKSVQVERQTVIAFIEQCYRDQQQTSQEGEQE